MNKHLISQTNKFSSYRFDIKNQRFVRKEIYGNPDIDQFLELQHLLDTHRISYAFEKNFQIHILNS